MTVLKLNTHILQLSLPCPVCSVDGKKSAVAKVSHH